MILQKEKACYATVFGGILSIASDQKPNSNSLKQKKGTPNRRPKLVKQKWKPFEGICGGSGLALS